MAADMARNCCARKPMSDWETLRLSPWQKWKKYGHPPWKPICAIGLVILTTWQVSLLNLTVTPYNRAQRENWPGLLMDLDDGETTSRIFTIDGLLEQIDRTVSIYDGLTNTSVDFFEYVKDEETGERLPIMLSLTRFVARNSIYDTDAVFDSRTVTTRHPLLPGERGEFDETDPIRLAALVHSLHEFSLAFEIRNTHVVGEARSCYHDLVTQHFSFAHGGRIDVSVSTKTRLCRREFEVFWSDRADSTPQVMLLSIFTLIVAVCFQFLHIKSIIKRVTIYNRAKLRQRKMSSAGEDDPWEQLSAHDKLKFFNVWFFVSATANIANIVGSILRIEDVLHYDDDPQWELAQLFVGLGCMFSWVLVVQYFEHSARYYVLILTLKKGTPRVLRFVVGVIPVFIGYAYFGVAMFSDTSEFFADLDAAAVTLFALLNGDVVHDIFADIYPAAPIISRIYLYTFVSLFIYAVLNIFIAIVEDAFFVAKAFSLGEELGPEGDDDDSTKKRTEVDVLALLEGPPQADTLDTDDVPKILRGNTEGFPGEEPLLMDDPEEQTLAMGPMDEADEDEDIDVMTTKLARKYGTDKAILTSVAEMHGALGREFRQTLRRQLEEHPGLKQARFRPPHHPDFYPCEFADCVHCAVRRVFVDSIQDLNRKVESALRDLALDKSGSAAAAAPSAASR